MATPNANPIMIFAEPPRNRFDVRFRVGRFPVRIHPFFWVSTLGLSLRPGATVLGVALWSVAVLVSILVHELGHASAFQRFGRKARITLYGFGGLASADAGRPLATRSRILVSAAGPCAGFAFAGIVAAVLLRLGYQVPLLHWTIGSGGAITNEALYLFVFDLMVINVIWGLINLLPVHPLDGGQIALELARAREPAHGAERSVWLSFFVAIVAAVVGLTVFAEPFTTFLFGYLAFMSWRVLRRTYGMTLGSLSPVRWTRGRWRSFRTARRKRSTRVRALTDLRSIEKLDARAANTEIDQVVGDLFDSVANDVGRVSSGEARGKPGLGGAGCRPDRLG